MQDTTTTTEEKTQLLTVSNIRFSKETQTQYGTSYMFNLRFNEMGMTSCLYFSKTKELEDFMVGDRKTFKVITKDKNIIVKLVQVAKRNTEREEKILILGEACRSAIALYVAGKIPADKIEKSVDYFNKIITERL